MDEEVQDQTMPEADTGSDRSTEDNAPVSESPVSEDQQNTEETSREVPPVPYEKFRDTRRENAQLKAELAKLQTGTTPAVAVNTQLGDDPDAAEALDAIASVIDQRMSPRLAVLEKIERREAIEDIGNRPYAGELAGEIVAAMKATPEGLPYSQRLEMAYKDALANNVDKLVASSSKKGYEDAYSKIAEKKSAQTVKSSSPTRGEPQIDTKNMTSDELRDNWATVLEKYSKQQ